MSRKGRYALEAGDASNFFDDIELAHRVGMAWIGANVGPRYRIMDRRTRQIFTSRPGPSPAACCCASVGIAALIAVVAKGTLE
jgi:hypothetical protein